MGFGCKISPTSQAVWIYIIKHHTDFSGIQSYSFNRNEVCTVIEYNMSIVITKNYKSIFIIDNLLSASFFKSYNMRDAQ